MPAFLTPMKPDGTKGELIEVQLSAPIEQQYLTPDGKVISVPVHNMAADSEQQFIEPVPYYTRNARDVGELRAQVDEAETALRHAESSGASWTQRTRLEQALESAKRELEAAEFGRRLERRREQTGGDDTPPARQSAPSATTQQAFNWSSMSFAQQTELIQAAIAEMRRAGAV